MPISVNVRSNVDSIIADMGRLKREAVVPATVAALNKVVDQGKTAGARAMRDAGYNLKVSDIKKSLTVYRASPGNLTAKIVASGRPIPLYRYGARQTAKGVSVNVLHGRKVITGAFIATMPSGHVGVYVRQGGSMHKKVVKNGRTRWTELPIKELFGPSVPDGLANKAVQDLLQQLMREKFPQVFEQQMKRFTR